MCWLPSRHSARRLEELSRSSRGLEGTTRSEEHTSELQSQSNLVCRLLLEKKKECKHSRRDGAVGRGTVPHLQRPPISASRGAAHTHGARRGRRLSLCRWRCSDFAAAWRSA